MGLGVGVRGRGRARGIGRVRDRDRVRARVQIRFKVRVGAGLERGTYHVPAAYYVLVLRTTSVPAADDFVKLPRRAQHWRERGGPRGDGAFALKPRA